MKIGLVRHFKVKQNKPEERINPQQFLEWKDAYDSADIKLEDPDPEVSEIAWQCCYTSDMPRAIRTAEQLYNGEIIQKAELTEFRSHPVVQGGIKLPLSVWEGLARAAWITRHKSQTESIPMLRNRISMVVDELLNNTGDVLVVSHGGVLMFMRKELLRRGFTGPGFTTPLNGKLYVFKKS
jgi:broad specificity phosphatase PhoE